MKAKVVECIIGLFIFNEENNLIDYVLFPKEAKKIAENLEKIQNGLVVSELSQLITKLKDKGYDQFVFESDLLARSVHNEFSVAVEVEKPSTAGEKLRQDLSVIAINVGYVKSPREILDLNNEVTLIIARIMVQQAAAKKDQSIIKSISIIDELDKTTNVFSNKIREWYSLHFPELNSHIYKQETYMQLVTNLGNRNNFTVERLQNLDLSPEIAKNISSIAKTSIGASLDNEDLLEIQLLSKVILEWYNARRQLERYIDKLMDEIAPNIKALVGSTLGARIIALVGGLENLAMKSSSTIQVLGAEKALFRSMLTGTKPPKHGIIFQHPALHKSPRWQRGKIARALSGKLMIAARIDAYGGKYIGDKIREEFEIRIKEIKEKNKAPM